MNPRSRALTSDLSAASPSAARRAVAGALVASALALTAGCAGSSPGKGALTPEEPLPLAGLDTFDACSRQVAQGLGVFYLCEQHGFGAFISEYFPWEDADMADNLGRFSRSSAESIHGPGGQVSVEVVPAPIGGTPIVLYSARGFGVGVPDFEGRYALARVREGVRVIACFTSSDWRFEGCGEILALLEPDRTFDALSARYKAGAPVFSGRALAVPSGCKKTGARTLTCPDSELAISPVPIPDLTQAAADMDLDQRQFFAGLCAAPVFWQAPCLLDGAEATCHHARCVDDAGALQGAVALTQVRNEPWAASCRFDPQALDGDAFPPVCAQLLDGAVAPP